MTHGERLRKYRLAVPVGDFVSSVSLLSSPGAGGFIVSEVRSDQLLGSLVTDPGSKAEGGEDAAVGQASPS